MINKISINRNLALQHNKGFNELMKKLPQDLKKALQKHLNSLNNNQKQDILSKLKELNNKHLSENELIKYIQNILNPAISNSAYNFSIYA